MIIRNMEESGSIRKEKETEKVPALNQSNTGTTTDLSEIERKIPSAIAKEARIVAHPIAPTKDLDNLLFKSPISVNPSKGNTGINHANCIILDITISYKL
jgi:hypothetical protein